MIQAGFFDVVGIKKVHGDWKEREDHHGMNTVHLCLPDTGRVTSSSGNSGNWQPELSLKINDFCLRGTQLSIEYELMRQTTTANHVIDELNT
jgi:hypothetical protein